MLMKISHQQLAVKTRNRWGRQRSAAVVALVILLHISVVYFISLGEIKRPNVVKPQMIEVQIIQLPPPKPVQKPVIIKPPEPPKITQTPTKPPAPAVEKTIPKVSKPNPNPAPPEQTVQDIPQTTVKPTATSVEKVVVSETSTINSTIAKNSNSSDSPSHQKTTSTAPPSDSSSDKAASTESRSGCSAPTYPEESALNGDQGTTTLALLIGENGKVLDAKIDRSSGFADLDRAAKKALSLCTFQPATRQGQLQQSWAKLSWKWQLKD
jgi:protein TonB